MRVFSTWLLVLLALGFAACDSIKEAEEDAERFRGEWELTAVSDDNGDRTADFEQLGVFSAQFESDDTFTLVLDEPGGSAEAYLRGDYLVVPATKKVTLTGESGGQDIQMILDYRFENNDNRLVLTVPQEAVALFNLATGFNFEGTVTFTLARP